MTLILSSFIFYTTMKACLSSVLKGSNITFNKSDGEQVNFVQTRSVPPAVIYGDDTSFTDDRDFNISDYDEEFAIFIDPPDSENVQSQSGLMKNEETIGFNSTRIWNNRHSIANGTIVHNIRISVVHLHQDSEKYRNSSISSDLLKVKEVSPERNSSFFIGSEPLSDVKDKVTVQSNFANISMRNCLKTCFQSIVTETEAENKKPVEYPLNSSTGAFSPSFLNDTSQTIVTGQPGIFNETFEQIKSEKFGFSPSLMRLEGSTEVAPRSQLPWEDICLTTSCVVKAAEILKRIDTTIDPCDNFYKFSCGKYLENEVFNGQRFRSSQDDVTSDILKEMTALLKSPVTSSNEPPLVLMKAFHAKCRETTREELIRDLIKEIGGWPRPHDPSWSAPYNTWQDLVLNWTYNVFLEHNLIMINLTHVNRSHWALNVDVPHTISLALKSNTSQYLDNIEEVFVLIGKSVNIDDTTIKKTVHDAKFFLESAIKCANSSVNNTTRGSFRLKELQKNLEHVDILRYLPWLLRKAVKIDEDEMINVSNMQYLERMNVLIRDTTTRTQTNFLIMNTILSLYKLVVFAGEDSSGKTCTKMAWSLFPRLMGNLYFSHFVEDSSVTRLLDILNKIRDMHEKSIKKSEWMDDTTKDKAVNALRKLRFVIAGHKSEDDLGIMDDFIKYQNSSIVNYIRSGINGVKRHTFRFLRQNFELTIPDFLYNVVNAYEVNAMSILENIIILPSFLYKSLYNEEYPLYINFGFSGLVFGHEITHGIMENLDFGNSSVFAEKESCLIDQFNGFEDDTPVNGRKTVQENIADLGGFREAYEAYVEYSRTVSKEKRLPGLERFNEKQMFWLSGATYWCTVYSTDPSVMGRILDDTHAPNERRINGQYANMPEFAEDFNCPPNTPMNPVKRCTLW